MLHGHTLSDAPNEAVFLKAAVEKGRREGVESIPPGSLCRLGEPQGVAVSAPFLFAEGDLPEELLHGIGLLPEDRELLLASIHFERLEALSILLIRVDVGIDKSTEDFPPSLPQYAKRVDGAGGTADMQQDSHGQITESVPPMKGFGKNAPLRITPSGRHPPSAC